MLKFMKTTWLTFSFMYKLPRKFLKPQNRKKFMFAKACTPKVFERFCEELYKAMLSGYAKKLSNQEKKHDFYTGNIFLNNL